jgi:hypothetical protein
MMTATQTETALDLKPGARGRKGRDGSEETIKLKPIKDAVRELMALYKKLEQAQSDYNNLRKIVAERSNCNSADLNKLIKSSAKGNYQDVRRHIEQQQVLFEGVGEVSASGNGAGE